MRTRTALLGIVGIAGLLVGLMPTAAVAKAPPPPPITLYAYEEIGPHSLLAEPWTGLQFMDPKCTPSFGNCVFYEFWDRWDVALSGNEVDTTNVVGTIDNHGYDNFQRFTVRGTFTLTLQGGTWSGGYSGTFADPSTAGGTFSLVGANGSRFAGTIAFLADGWFSMTGVIR